MVIAPDEKDVVNATAMEQMMDMDAVTGSCHIAAMYGRRCYIGRLVKAVVDMCDVTRGKRKWRSSDDGLVDNEPVLLLVRIPQAVDSGALLAIIVRETHIIRAKCDNFTLYHCQLMALRGSN